VWTDIEDIPPSAQSFCCPGTKTPTRPGVFNPTLIAVDGVVPFFTARMRQNGSNPCQGKVCKMPIKQEDGKSATFFFVHHHGLFACFCLFVLFITHHCFSENVVFGSSNEFYIRVSCDKRFHFNGGITVCLGLLRWCKCVN